MDKKRFGKIIVANEEAYKIGAKPYYTNSTQLPVGFTEDVFEALDLQDEMQCKYTGGTTFHTFIGEKISKEAAKTMAKKISSNYHIPYFTITPTFSICPIHGYLAGEHEYCPKCDLEIAQAEASPVSVADDVKMEIAEDEVIEKKNVEVEEPCLVAPSIVVSGDTITVVERSDSKLNIGGDTNVKNEM